jgi:hypothetical protein
MTESFYGNLFMSEPCDSTAVLDSIHAKISTYMNDDLLIPYMDEEIRMALYQMGSIKALGPDGFPDLFYQEHWDLLKADICTAIRVFFYGQRYSCWFL